MNDTYVTLQGWVGGDVTLRDGGGAGVVNLRVGSTPRFKRGEEYVDGDTTWYTVTAWRRLAENICRSVRKGDPVIVHGRLRTRFYERQDGQQASSLEIEATLVGHDLTRGVSWFTRPPRAESDRNDEEQGEEQGEERGEVNGEVHGAPAVAAPDWASGLGDPAGARPGTGPGAAA